MNIGDLLHIRAHHGNFTSKPTSPATPSHEHIIGILIKVLPFKKSSLCTLLTSTGLRRITISNDLHGCEILS